MRKLIFLILLCSAPVWAADCRAGNVNLSNGVTCVFAGGTAGVSTNQSQSGAITIGTQTGNGVVIMAYFCYATDCSTAPADWVASHSYTKGSGAGGLGNGASEIYPSTNNPCGFAYVTTTSGTSGTAGNQPVWNNTSSACLAQTNTISDNGVVWTPLYAVIANGVPSTISCFAYSQNSPYYLQNNNMYQNFIYYCPSMSTDTLVELNCSVGVSCSFMSIFASVYTGMCSTAPCFDAEGDVNGNCVSCQSATPQTSTSLKYTKDLVVSLTGTIQDNETWAVAGGCVMIDNTSPAGGSNNPVAAKTLTNGGSTGSCAWSFSDPADTIGSMVVAIKSSSSVLAKPGNQFPRMYGMLRAAE